MKEAFVFKTELWVPNYTGIRADNLKGFIEAVEKVENTSLLYHLYINVFNYHNLPSYYANSFAYWLYVNGYRTLAEKISQIDPTEYCDLEEVRQRLLEVLNGYKGEEPACSIEPFYFMSVYREVLETGIQANSVEELIDGIRSSSINSLFYHLVMSKVEKRSLVNDYSQWLIREGYHKKAEQISKLDIYAYNLYELKEKLIDILEEP